MFFRNFYLLALAAYLSGKVSAAKSVSSTILVFARDASAAGNVTSGLQGYGIPYQVVTVPYEGIKALPTLNSSITSGNYGGIIILSEVSYNKPDGFISALTSSQLSALYSYQEAFGVRMVRLDVFPATDLGVTVIDGGCCNDGAEQLISFNDTSSFPTANIKGGATVSTVNLWHYPARIIDPSIARPIAKFGDSAIIKGDSTAAIINTFGSRQQMVFFISWATDWSLTSNFLQHAWIHWITRGLFVGKRKVYVSAQVDDILLSTDVYRPVGQSFRLRPSDLDAHNLWQTSINSRLPSGSKLFIEMGYNGNGDIISSVATSAGQAQCSPREAVSYESPGNIEYFFKKPLGTGKNLWTSDWTKYPWSSTCAKLDNLTMWFINNPNIFAHVSHTFTHEELNNATYHDAALEIQFNVDWLKQIGLWTTSLMSTEGLIPPAITGLLNGDAIKAWMDNGIKYVVGDNTRPTLRNKVSSFYALTSTVQDNGYAGLKIIPRFATTIYYNCDTAYCTTQEWIDTSGGKGTFDDLLIDARKVNVRNLLGLHPDPYMFHQANMRQGDVESITVGSQTGRLSLLQIWTEVVTQELARLTNWPVFSLKHDDLGKLFVDRETLDTCAPNLTYLLSDDNSSITGVKVKSNNNICAVKVPVTFPGTATTTASGNTQDKVGTEPLIYWTQLSGSAVTYTLGSAVAV